MIHNLKFHVKHQKKKLRKIKKKKYVEISSRADAISKAVSELNSGDVLIVALNSDSSVRKIKGSKRPIVPLEQRAFVIANLKSVDFVTVFEEETPANIISDLVPDFLVKGADWDVSKIVGREVVENSGGEIKTIEFVNNVSTTKIIEVIAQRFCK